jgi:hypothetical protein
MLNEFDFHVTQVRYIKAAVHNYPAYAPDGKDEAAIDAMLTVANDVRDDYIEEKEIFDLARSGFRQAVNDLHDANVGVYAAMKSRYRKDPASLETIEALPVQDQTADETIKRAEQISSLWSKLPDIGTPPAPFVAWQEMDKAAFDVLKGSAKTKKTDLPDKDQAFQVAEGNLHATDADLADFATAALAQGRAQFRSGPAREVIDAIPTEPAQQPPGQAVISQATGGAGTLHLVFDAPHATSFDVFQKKTSEPASAFTKVADDIVEHSYGDGLVVVAGSYNFKVTGRNSLGEGPESEVSTVNVT